MTRRKTFVAAGYDAMAEQYLATREADDPYLLAWLRRLAQGVPPTARTLDLGCGAGVPATQWLADRFATAGVDLSARQLALARQHVPRATLVRSDMASVAFAPRSFRAIVALYSIIHVPREEHAGLIDRIHNWLQPGGSFLATWPITAWEGEEANWEGWGATMWWSHYDRATYEQMLRTTGFAIAQAETRTHKGETWLWLLARK